MAELRGNRAGSRFIGYAAAAVGGGLEQAAQVRLDQAGGDFIVVIEKEKIVAPRGKNR